jgi:hypothetical protein
MYERMTRDNCGVHPLLILRIVERGYLMHDLPLSTETFEYESNDPYLINYACDPTVDYRPDYSDEEAA